MNIFDKTYILKGLLVFITILFLFGLYQRPPHVDDAWLGEHAWLLCKTGQAKSELMRGITQQEEKLVVHHKFHIYQGNALIKIFGFSIYTLKAVSLLYFVVFLLIFYGYTYRKLFSYREFLFALILLFFNALIFEYSFVYRPEIPQMAMGFVAYIFLEKSLKKKGCKWCVLIAGLFSGLAVSTHLNGLIFPIAGFFLLIWNKKYKLSLLFGLFVIPTTGIYFLDMLSIRDLDLWYLQFAGSPSIDALNYKPFAIQILLRILDEQMRFFHSPLEISFTILFLASIILAYKNMKPHRNLLRYTLLLVASLTLLSFHKTSKYIILYLPFLVMIITLSAKYIYSPNSSLTFISCDRRKAVTKVFSSLVILYLIVQTIYIVPVVFNKFQPVAHRKLVAKYIGGNTDSLNIIVPMTFVFNEIENFNRIQGDICYNELKKADPTIYKEGFLKKANSFDIDYIILKPFFMSHFGLDKMSPAEVIENDFIIIHSGPEFTILKSLKINRN